MKPLHIGFYVHYHGLGHKHRTEAILQHLTVPASVVTSRIANLAWQGPTLDNVVEIACDIDEVSQAGLKYAGDVPAMHYAPLWTNTITKRVSQYTEWLQQYVPDVMVVDVSAEISLLTRLASIPQVVMRQHGDRSDPAHLGAYAAAHSLLAPFPESLEDDVTPDWVRRKTTYLDGFCRNTSGFSQPVTYDRPTIVVIFGRGGNQDRHAALAEAASTVKEYDWIVVGKSAPDCVRLPENLSYAGWCESPHRYVTNSAVVVTAAGHNSIMELGSLKARMIAIAEKRPFDEQVRKAIVLNREGLAVGVDRWPDKSEWPTLIEQALLLDVSRWNKVFASDGAETAANHITKVARWSRRERESHGTSCQSAS